MPEKKTAVKPEIVEAVDNATGETVEVPVADGTAKEPLLDPEAVGRLQAVLDAPEQEYDVEVEVLEYLIGTEFGLATDDQKQRKATFKQTLAHLLKDGYRLESDVTAPHPMGGSVAVYVLVKWTFA